MVSAPPVSSAPLSFRPHSPRRPGTSHEPTPADLFVRHTHATKISGYRRFTGAARGSSYKSLLAKGRSKVEPAHEQHQQRAATPRGTSALNFPHLNIFDDVPVVPPGWDSKSRTFDRMVSRDQLNKPVERVESARGATPSFVSDAFFVGETVFVHAKPSPRTPSVLRFDRPTSAKSARPMRSSSSATETAGNATPQQAPLTHEEQLRQDEAAARRTRRLQKRGYECHAVDANTVNTIENGPGGVHSTKRGVRLDRGATREEAAYAAGTGPNPHTRLHKQDLAVFYGTASSGAIRNALLGRGTQRAFEPFSLGPYEVVEPGKKTRAPIFEKYLGREATREAARPRGMARWKLRVTDDDTTECGGVALPAAVAAAAVSEQDFLNSAAGGPTSSFTPARVKVEHHVDSDAGVPPPQVAAASPPPAATAPTRFSPRRSPEIVQTQTSRIRKAAAATSEARSPRVRCCDMAKSPGKDARPYGFTPASHLAATSTSASTPCTKPLSTAAVDRHVPSVNLSKAIPKPPPHQQQQRHGGGGGGAQHYPKWHLVDHRASVPYLGAGPARGGSKSPSGDRKREAAESQHRLSTSAITTDPTSASSAAGDEHATARGWRAVGAPQNDVPVHPRVTRDIYFGGSRKNNVFQSHHAKPVAAAAASPSLENVD